MVNTKTFGGVNKNSLKPNNWLTHLKVKIIYSSRQSF